MRDRSKPVDTGGETIPDANVSKIEIAGDAPGQLFTVGAVAIFFAGLPQARWFLAVSLPAGLIVAAILRLTARDRG